MSYNPCLIDERLSMYLDAAMIGFYSLKTFVLHGKNKYWEIYMTECSTFRYVQKLLKTRSTVLVQLDQKSWKMYRTFQKYSVESPSKF